MHKTTENFPPAAFLRYFCTKKGIPGIHNFASVKSCYDTEYSCVSKNFILYSLFSSIFILSKYFSYPFHPIPARISQPARLQSHSSPSVPVQPSYNSAVHPSQSAHIQDMWMSWSVLSLLPVTGYIRMVQ